MYNAVQKQEFIRYFGSRQNVSREEINLATKALNWVQMYELTWECDLCCQTDTSELQVIVDWLMHKVVPRSGYDYLIVLRSYVRWCRDKKIPNAVDSLLKVTSDNIDEEKLSSVGSPLQLQNFLSAIYKPEIEHSTDNTFRAFYWIAFSGIEEKDAYHLTTKDVDLENMKIHYGGFDYQIYKEGVPALKSCAEDKYFSYQNNSYKIGEIQRPRVSGDLLLRGVRASSSLENKYMRVQVSRKQKEAMDNKQIVLSLSYFKVWKSGIFYREWIRESDGGFASQAFDDIAKIMLQVGNRSYKEDVASVETKYKRIVREFDREYKRWKIAHGYA